jgi:hypothetical protein
MRERQRVFVEEYLQCWNASEAARRAGYKGRPNTIGQRLLSNVDIQAAVQARIKEKALSADECLLRVADQARSSLAVFFSLVEGWSSSPLPYSQVIETRRLVDTDEDGVEFVHYEYLTRRVELDTAKLLDPRYAHLLKKFSDTKRGGLVVELHDAQAALFKLGEHLQLWKATSVPDVNLHVEGLKDILDRIYGNPAGE